MIHTKGIENIQSVSPRDMWMECTYDRRLIIPFGGYRSLTANSGIVPDSGHIKITAAA